MTPPRGAARLLLAGGLALGLRGAAVHAAEPEDAGWQDGRTAVAPVPARPTPTWTRTLAAPTRQPLTTDGAKVFVVDGAGVTAFGGDGALRWKWAGEVGAAPVPAAEGLWVPGTDHLRLLDPATGAPRGEGLAAPPADVTPVAAPELRWVDLAGTLHGGSGWTVPLGGRAAGPPAAAGPRTWVATTAGDLVIVENAAVVRSVALGAPARGGPATDGVRVYVPVAARAPVPGGVVALDRDGAVAWRWSARLEPGAPLAVGRHVYVPDRGGRLVALDPASGRVDWEVEGFGPFTTRPILAGAFVYAADGDGNLYAIEAADGGVAWTLALGAPPAADPVLLPGRLVVALADGRVVAYGGAP